MPVSVYEGVPISPSPSVNEKVMVSVNPFKALSDDTETKAIFGMTEYVGGLIHEYRVHARRIYTKAALRIDSKKQKLA